MSKIIDDIRNNLSKTKWKILYYERGSNEIKKTEALPVETMEDEDNEYVFRIKIPNKLERTYIAGAEILKSTIKYLEKYNEYNKRHRVFNYDKPYIVNLNELFYVEHSIFDTRDAIFELRTAIKLIKFTL